MKVILPKELRGTVYNRLFLVEMNDFDIDMFLPSWFYKILSGDRERRNQTNDPKDIRRYVTRLAEHPDVLGFEDAETQQTLNRLVRTSLIKTGTVGQARRGEQIITTVPFSLLDHKPGINESRRLRKGDSFIYRALLNEFRGNEAKLREFTKKVFGKGVEVPTLPHLGGKYDGKTEVDTLTRLSFAFLDGFDTIGFKGAGNDRNSEEVGRRAAACPVLEKELAQDIISFLEIYHTRMPSQALFYYLMALCNLELFNYALKLVYATNELVSNPQVLPSAMSDNPDSAAPLLYVDFTGGVRGLSQEMARACIRRDIETYQKFARSNLLLRQLDKYISSLADDPERAAVIRKYTGAGNNTAIFLQGLLLMQTDQAIKADIMAAARSDLEKIKEETFGPDKNSDRVKEELAQVFANATNDVDRVVTLLVEAQSGDTVSKYLIWHNGVAGLRKPHGIMSMSGKDRRVWRYAPSNDFLALLVQLAAARKAENGHLPESFPLHEFLDFIRRRFGILVDQPPPPFAGPEYVAAARDNLAAMLGRLRQMGIFRDLSDDFTVQRLQPPYSQTKEAATAPAATDEE